MAKVYNGTAVPRHFIFVSPSGGVLVQLSGSRAQDLHTGQFSDLTAANQGSPASDAELDRLKIAGRIDHYNSAYAWVTGLPEPHVYDPQRATSEVGKSRVRSYYVNTLLAASHLDDVYQLLQSADLLHVCIATVHSDMVAITGPDGALFGDFNQAQEIRAHLVAIAPEAFSQSVVAFTTIELRDSQLVHELRPADKTSELEAIIAAQTDTRATQGKTLLLLVTSLEERKLIYNLCVELKINIDVAASATEALTCLEDGSVDLLIMDLQLPDMHSWEMLGKIREVEALRQLPIILIADHAMPEDASLTKAVANVDVYLERPLSKARLRQNIWMALHG